MSFIHFVRYVIRIARNDVINMTDSKTTCNDNRNSIVKITTRRRLIKIDLITNDGFQEQYYTYEDVR